MRCEDVRDRLDDYVEGTLSGEERGALAAHLEACVDCRAESQAWRGLFARTATLPRSIEPARDLWDGIEAALDAPATAPRRTRLRARPLGLLAAAIALVVVTAAVTSLLHREWDSAVARKLKGFDPSPRAVDPGPSPTTEELLRSLEAQRLPPETIAVVQRNLAIIDVAITELEAALARDPGNEDLARMLVSTHRKRAELVERAARVREDG